jgi:hypothetical protein
MGSTSYNTPQYVLLLYYTVLYYNIHAFASRWRASCDCHWRQAHLVRPAACPGCRSTFSWLSTDSQRLHGNVTTCTAHAPAIRAASQTQEPQHAVVLCGRQVKLVTKASMVLYAMTACTGAASCQISSYSTTCKPGNASYVAVYITGSQCADHLLPYTTWQNRHSSQLPKDSQAPSSHLLVSTAADFDCL